MLPQGIGWPQLGLGVPLAPSQINQILGVGSIVPHGTNKVTPSEGKIFMGDETVNAPPGRVGPIPSNPRTQSWHFSDCLVIISWHTFLSLDVGSSKIVASTYSVCHIVAEVPQLLLCTWNHTVCSPFRLTSSTLARICS